MFRESFVDGLVLVLPLINLSLGRLLFFWNDKRFFLYLQIINFLSSLLIIFFVFHHGAYELNLVNLTAFSSLKINFGLRADELSSTVLCMIQFISLCITKYSIPYFEGDPNKIDFFKNYHVSLFFVSLLVLSNNLLMFFLAWLGISYGLHKLLVYFPNRKKALLAAKKKWFVSRIGDSAVFIAIVLTFYFFKTISFSDLISLSHNSQTMAIILNEKYFSFIGLFIAIGALAKSAQFPLHFWLPETMETPTPVSALMHAGIINAGGFLILRFSPILTHAQFAHTILIVFGGLSAVFGALVMMAQTDIKKQLAYSTMSQMGFMMIQCGIGAYTFALFHIIVHSFYKAHAFLSTASVLEERKAPKRNLSYFGLIASYFISGIIISFSFVYKESPQVIYIGILTLAMTQVIGSRQVLISALKNNFLYASFFFIISFAIYILFEFGLSYRFKVIMPPSFYSGVLNKISILFIFVLFSFGLYLAKEMQDLKNKRSIRIFIFFFNEGYFPSLSKKMFKLNPGL